MLLSLVSYKTVDSNLERVSFNVWKFLCYSSFSHFEIVTEHFEWERHRGAQEHAGGLAYGVHMFPTL